MSEKNFRFQDFSGMQQRVVPAGGLQLIESTESVSVRHIEIVQSIQDENNSVAMIANKATVLRLYLEKNVGAVSVTGEIAWSRDGAGESFLPALNFISLPNSPEALLAQRSDFSKSLNFLLPPDSIMAGELKIRVTRIFAAHGDLNLGSAQVFSCHFDDSAPLRIRAIGLRYKNEEGTRYSPDAVHFSYLRSYLRRSYPAAIVEWTQIVIDADFEAPFDDETPIAANAQLAAIRSREISSGIDIRTHYYGLVSDANGQNFMRGLAFDIPETPRPDVVASGPAGLPRGFAGDNDLSYADWYGAHELGHTFGRYHPGFPGPDELGGQDSSDPHFPYPEGRITTPEQNFVGFDVGDAELGLPMKVLPGELHHDVMTYKDNQWVSAYTYLAIQSRLNAEQSIMNFELGEH